MDSPEFTIYVGMALTDAPEEFRTIFHDELKSKLREIPGVKVLDFFWVSNGPIAGDDIEVYNLDESHSQNADLFVAVLDHPSIGLGMEIMIRHFAKKPALLLAKEGKRISRMPLGYIKKFGIPRARYESVNDIVSKVLVMKEYLELMNKPFRTEMVVGDDMKRSGILPVCFNFFYNH